MIRTTSRVWGAVTALALGLMVPPVGEAQTLGSADQPDMTLSAADRAAVIEGVLKGLNDAYVFPEVARKMDKAVRDRVKRKEYDSVTSAKALAEKLTGDLRAVSNDKHLRIRYSHEALPDFSASKLSPQEMAEHRRFGDFINRGFERVERLPGNIGYLKFQGFFDPEAAGETAAAAMAFLANTDALIIDLRENGGGSPAMVALMCSYFFEEPTHLNDIYSRKDNSTHQYWTLPYVPGKRYLEKPVYLLTSAYTFSGAEEFTYNLKNLKRATIVGETTGGGAHPVTAHRVNDHFMVGVPFARAINPITGTNWEGTGVTPDVAVPKDQALHTAQLMALKRVQEKNTDPENKSRYQEAIEKVQQELEAIKQQPPAQGPSR